MQDPYAIDVLHKTRYGWSDNWHDYKLCQMISGLPNSIRRPSSFPSRQHGMILSSSIRDAVHVWFPTDIATTHTGCDRWRGFSQPTLDRRVFRWWSRDLPVRPHYAFPDTSCRAHSDTVRYLLRVYDIRLITDEVQPPKRPFGNISFLEVNWSHADNDCPAREI